MSYQVIARRWRPRKFSEVVGQEHVTRTLQNALKQGRLAHAFLFTGPRGVGKTSTARILARAINCPNFNRNNDGEPCNECESCHALLEDRELDVIEMDAASNTGVDDVRKINDAARLVPAAGLKKIFIIDEVHMLSKAAFNAFLKTLEEPPPHVIFILATTDAQKVPATIRSRVQRFDFRPLSPSEIAAHLKHICGAENWPADEEALWIIARHAEGSLRDAEGLLDHIVSFSGNRVTLAETREALGALPEDLLSRATEIIAHHRIAELPGYFQTLARSGTDYTLLLRELQRFWMDLIFLKEKLDLPGKSPEEIETLNTIGDALAVEDLFRLIKLASTLEDDLKWAVAPRVRFEVAFMRWATLDRAVSIQQIIEGLPASGSTAQTRSSGMSLPPAPEKKTAANNPEPKSETPSPTNGKSPHGETPSGGLTLETLRSRWPEIVSRLEKSKPAAAALAHSSWELVDLVGTRLTLRPKESGPFHLKQLKDYLPNVAEAIKSVTGQMLALVGVEASSVKPETAPVQTKKENPTLTSDSDLFSRVKNQFGGEEVPGGES